MSRVAHAVLLRKLVEIGLWLVHDHAGRAGRLALSDPALLEQRDVYAGRGKDVRRRASDRTTADDGDLGAGDLRGAGDRRGAWRRETGRAR